MFGRLTENSGPRGPIPQQHDRDAIGHITSQLEYLFFRDMNGFSLVPHPEMYVPLTMHSIRQTVCETNGTWHTNMGKLERECTRSDQPLSQVLLGYRGPFLLKRDMQEFHNGRCSALHEGSWFLY